MCGIFGFNTSNSVRTEQYFADLAHRGPDATASSITDPWTLGHLRLSIIDTSVGANQPFVKDDNVLVFNGEIYNYLELRQELLSEETMATESDTEVLITLLNKYGVGILNRLNGMFAFAWYNTGEKKLYLCRDRFGVKPLYYTVHDGAFYFASELRPLAHTRKSVSFDDSILDHYMRETATDFDTRSGLTDISAVQNGHYLTVDTTGTYYETKWYTGHDYQFDTSVFGDREKTITAFEELLTDAITLRHRSDVPVCITLSGGLDSTTIYVLAKQHLKSKIQPFVFAHTGAKTDESDRAIALAAQYGDIPIVIENSTATSRTNLMAAIRALEFPTWNPSALAYIEMYQAIKARGYTVVIEGHGSDEQLGGYPYMIEAAWKQALLRGQWQRARLLYRVWNETQNPALGQVAHTNQSIDTFIAMTKGLVRGIVKGLIWPTKRKYLNFEMLVAESFSYKILPIVLRTFDRLSMSQSLESRCPFMDYRVVEFIRALPQEYKINELGSKAILREILKKYEHSEIYTHKHKMGFASDIPALFKQSDVVDLFTDAINRFDIPQFQNEKASASELIRKESIGWSDISLIWKIGALRLTQDLYE